MPALGPAAIGVAFQFVFDPSFGLIQDLLAKIGVASPDFYQKPGWALFMVTATYIWKNLGYCAVIYLAGLQSIPQDLLEAAAIDGAGPIRRFFNVTLPLLSPTVFFLSIAMVLSSMQAFDILRIMTPTGNGTNSIVFEIYLQSFGTYQRAGYAAAISVRVVGGWRGRMAALFSVVGFVGLIIGLGAIGVVFRGWH